MTDEETVKQMIELRAALDATLAKWLDAAKDVPQPKQAIRSVRVDDLVCRRVGDLEWQADVPDKRFTWKEAKDYAASLGDGWRLPTIKELLILVDYESGNSAWAM